MLDLQECVDPVAWHVRPKGVEGPSAQGTPMPSSSAEAEPISISGEREEEPNS